MDGVKSMLILLTVFVTAVSQKSDDQKNNRDVPNFAQLLHNARTERENSRIALNPSHYQVVESTMQKYSIVIEGLANVEREFESVTTEHFVDDDLGVPQDSNTALGSIHRNILSDALYELSDMMELESMNVFSGSSSLKDAKVGILGQIKPKKSRNETLTALSKSFDYLIRAAALGHQKAQHRLATAYATGIYGTALVPMDAGRSLALEYMAALGGDPEAAIGMGYRHLFGIGVPESCKRAEAFYEIAANEAAEQIRLKGAGGTNALHAERVKLSDVEVAIASGRREVDPEIIDYYRHLTAGGDSAAAHTLGMMFTQGSRYVDQNVTKAMRFFGIAASSGHVASSAQLGYLKAIELSLHLESKAKATSSSAASDYQAKGAKGDPPSATAGASSAKGEGVAALSEHAVLSKGIESLDIGNRSELAEYVNAIFKVLRYAANRGDAVGVTGLGYLFYTGLAELLDDFLSNKGLAAVLGPAQWTAPQQSQSQSGLATNAETGQAVPASPASDGSAPLSDSLAHTSTQPPVIVEKAGVAKAYDLFHKVAAKSPDAGFYMGEILMGRKPAHSFKAKNKSPAQDRNDATSSSRVSDQTPSADGRSRSTSTDSAHHQHQHQHQHQHPGLRSDVEPPHQTMISVEAMLPDPAAAAQSYALSGQRGSLLALHRLAHLAAVGLGTQRSCQTAVNAFRNVAERGEWSHALTIAHRLADFGDRESALAVFSRMASIGFETAQFNAAHLLTKTKDSEMPWLPEPPSLSRLQDILNRIDKSKLSDGGASGHEVNRQDTPNVPSNLSSSLFRNDANWWPRLPSDEHARGTGSSLLHLSAYNFSLPQLKTSASTRKDCEARSLILYALSASQGNPEAQLRVGDFHYYGKAGLRPDKFEAAVFYQLAADLRNTHAIFNLGIMHEAGDGVEQDFHLAKRFFDQAAEVDADARTPRALALFVLNSHRSVQDALGPDAAARLAELIVACDGLTDFANRLLEFGSGVYKRIVEVAARSNDRDVHRATDASIPRIGNLEVAMPLPREGIQEVALLIALGALFVLIQRWRSSRRRNNIAHLHAE